MLHLNQIRTIQRYARAGYSVTEISRLTGYPRHEVFKVTGPLHPESLERRKLAHEKFKRANA